MDDADRHAELVGALLATLDHGQRREATRGFADDAVRRGWSYLPGQREGLALHALDRGQQQAALRLVAAALRPHAFAQVAAVMAFEDVLDLQEGGSGRRHRGDYWVTVFGVPGEDRWGWRFEGHHVSVNLTIADGAASAAPLFLGANPAVVRHAGADVLRPLAREEDLARALVEALDPATRSRAVLSADAPSDIRTGRRPHVGDLPSEGVQAEDLAPDARRLLQQLVAVYQERLPEPLAVGDRDDVRFQWRGPTGRGEPHYYALSGPRLLVEYDNTQDGANHVHTVLRDPRGDFGADLLGANHVHTVLRDPRGDFGADLLDEHYARSHTRAG